jgi:RHS repeat-associated protein
VIHSTGKERDAETGLDYFGARYYSGAQGRFTSPDTPFADQNVGNPQSWNLYAYVSNNPLKFTDPSGQQKELVTGPAKDLANAGIGICNLIQKMSQMSRKNYSNDPFGVPYFEPYKLNADEEAAAFVFNVATIWMAWEKDAIYLPAAIEKLLMPFQNKYIKFKNRTTMMDPNLIRFSQDSCKAIFSDTKYGSIEDLVKALENSEIDIKNFKPIRLAERDGIKISIDNRRLEAFRQAKAKIPVRMATDAEIDEALRMDKFSAGEHGTTTIRIRGKR